MGTPKGSTPWNAGTSKGWTDKRGYRWVYVVENGKRRARREHRVVVEAHIGRRLEPWELVHHRDGDKTNNCIDNLEVQEFGAHTAEHHTGGRKSEDARRSMEAFALLREELKAKRSINAELLEALKQINDWCRYATEEDTAARLMALQQIGVHARAAIANATGEGA